MRVPLVLLLLLVVACESAEHKALSRRIGGLAGDRVVSNKLEAPPGASWKQAYIQTRVHRMNDKAHLFVKEWEVSTVLSVVIAPEVYAGTELSSLEEDDDGADLLAEQALRTYQLRLAGPDELEFSSDDGKTWTRIPVPRRDPPPPPPPPDADVD